MVDFLAFVLGGGFAGAAVAAALAKYLVENQLSKSLKSYQHELDLKKDALQTDLSIYAAGERQKVVDYEQKRVLAIEIIYSAFVRTSLPHHRFQNNLILPYGESTAEALQGAYFQIFKQNFDSFKNAFDSVTEAFAVLEKNAIYIEEDLEQEVARSLVLVNESFAGMHQKLQQAHVQAQQLLHDKTLGGPDTWFDFGAFYTELNADWNRVTGSIRNALKNRVRGVLKPMEGVGAGRSSESTW